jgi:hypothetical protein
MAKQGRTGPSQDGERQVKPSNSIFFINKDLVRFVTSNRGQNIAYLFNITQNKSQTMLLSDFKKHRKRAYTVVNTARLLNRGPAQIYRYVNDGLIDPPTGAQPGGERKFTKLSYYSEDDVFAIREAMSRIPRGRPRKDGKISNNSVLTEQELRAKMGDALMLYTRTKDGEFIPVWSEQTY